MFVAGLAIGVRLHRHPRRDPQPEPRAAALRRGQRFQEGQLLQAIHDNGLDSGLQRGGQFCGGFVVAVQMNFFRWEAGLQGDAQFAQADDVHTGSQRGDFAGKTGGEIGFRGVGDFRGTGVRGGQHLSQPGELLSHRRAVVEVEGRAPLPRQVTESVPCDGELAAGTRRRDREYLKAHGRYLVRRRCTSSAKREMAPCT
ncbi:MAG: hypothetical protein BWY25_02033 [Chloroflexi bacterium ADurb.Bin222]|nr:MAG: hypothetical protein BWY25_02033 [Chloroflexi bacterium ADurb.Bin222]